MRMFYQYTHDSYEKNILVSSGCKHCSRECDFFCDDGVRVACCFSCYLSPIKVFFNIADDPMDPSPEVLRREEFVVEMSSLDSYTAVFFAYVTELNEEAIKRVLVHISGCPVEIVGQ